MSRIQRAIMGLLESEVARPREWDGPPGLFLIAMEGATPHLAPLRVPPFVWDADRPPQVLEAIAEGVNAAARRGRAPAPPQGLHGAAFFFEGWQLYNDPADPEAMARIHRLAGQHRLYTHPDRVEVRFICAVDRAGFSYQAALRRDTGELDSEVQRNRTGQSAGTIPEALDLLVAAILGVDLPPRPSGLGA